MFFNHLQSEVGVAVTVLEASKTGEQGAEVAVWVLREQQLPLAWQQPSFLHSIGLGWFISSNGARLGGLEVGVRQWTRRSGEEEGDIHGTLPDLYSLEPHLGATHLGTICNDISSVDGVWITQFLEC